MIVSLVDMLSVVFQEAQAEKQRVFEEAMMSGVSEHDREAIWKSAQQNAVCTQNNKYYLVHSWARINILL